MNLRIHISAEEREDDIEQLLIVAVGVRWPQVFHATVAVIGPKITATTATTATAPCKTPSPGR